VAQALAPPRTFNTPLEAGLRALFLMSIGTRTFDSRRLVVLDYILVHSGDLGGDPSLHPESPSQKGELLVRHELIQDGLALMRSRDLLERRFSGRGITYRATKAGRHVVAQFDSEYAGLLRKRAGWVIENFGPMSDRQLSEALREHIGDWDDELIVDFQPDAGGRDDA
jgi:hypothetical protein